jgi:hypothetical protein
MRGYISNDAVNTTNRKFERKHILSFLFCNQGGPMKEVDEPLQFIREAEPKWLLANVLIGAAVGALGGALLYRRGQTMVSNVLSQTNYSVMERYHPNQAA